MWFFLDLSRIQKYAAMIAKVGGAIQQGQEVFITGPVEQPDFVSMLVEECYKCGAEKVIVTWTHSSLQKINSRYCSLETMSRIEDYEIARFEHQTRVLPVMIYLESDDPLGLEGADMDKITESDKIKRPIIRKYRDKMENRYQWSIAAIPGRAWARRVFPGCSDEEAVEKLWNAILDSSLVYGDAVANWKEHDSKLQERNSHLNSLHLTSLHYHASNGTDLTVGLVPSANFLGGSSDTIQGVHFQCNIPSEESFTSPDRMLTEGIVYSSLPLSYNGQIIEDFMIRFEKGKAVEWHAKKNEKLLTQILTTDEGSSYLGECALIPFDSPIRNTGILFYNTLFDENASCHLALGSSYSEVLNDYKTITLEEGYRRGLNKSCLHVDFMIGTQDMNIDGITADKRKVPIFINGNWAF